MCAAQRTRHNTKNTFIAKRLISLTTLLKKRTRNIQIQAIKSELAARTLYVVDGDTIVITSLDKKPFCCQEELSVMCRQELCRVVQELNQKLPSALRIDHCQGLRSDAIRFRIEEVMGFRHLKRRVWASTNQPQPAPELSQLLFQHVRRGRRSPTSSFSSGSSRSSSPYGLAVVNEIDESSEILWLAPPNVKHHPSSKTSSM
ncbi:hypothetical protein K439DRAFT_862082 [Ramaria rubella]|nr:hypothetical protein K439DRAFT_862082 [Ramaria rubella]